MAGTGSIVGMERKCAEELVVILLVDHHYMPKTVLRKEKSVVFNRGVLGELFDTTIKQN